MAPTLAERILEALSKGVVEDDDQLAARLNVSPRQSVNARCRETEASGQITRSTGPDGKIVNRIVAGFVPPEPAKPDLPGAGRITEDEVKEAVRSHLAADAWDVAVAWGRAPGVDIDARRGDERLLIEAKAEVERNAQNYNYFVGALGELVQRMEDPTARYGLALPDSRQYRGLVDRLPDLAKQRLDFSVFWINRDGEALTVTVKM